MTSNRIPLTYPPVTFGRLAAYGITCLLTYALIRWLSPQQGRSLVVVACGASAFLFILEALFVLQQRLFQKQLAYDQENLYITNKDEETTVPLRDITGIGILSVINRGARGNYSQYAIDYRDNGTSARVRLSLYRKQSPYFETFRELVKTKNPAVVIKLGSI